MPAIIFDLDGTLIDSAPDIHSCANILLKNNGYDSIELALARSFIGDGIPTFIKRIIRHVGIEYSKDLHEKLSLEFFSIYANNPTSNNALYPNVKSTLSQLHKQGLKLGICTNKTYKLTMLIIKQLELEQYFNSIIGGDSLPTKKPNPEMLFASINELGEKEAIFVGDSEIDASAAKNANVPFLLFTKGYLKKPENEIIFSAKFDDFSELEQKIAAI